jgi:hypothetical protein
MRSAITILLLCVSGVLRAADGGPADLALVGVDSAKIGESVRLRLDGLPAVDLTKTMNEQLAWLSQVRIITSAPKGVAQGEYTLDQQLSIKVSPFQWTFSLDFSAKKPGDFVLIVDWNESPYGLVYHRISVGGTVPTDPTFPPDDPNHPPNDPNNPQKIDRVTYVWEKDSGPVPRQVSAALQRINAERSGIVASEFEDDTTDGNGEVPDQYKAALAASKTAGVPVLGLQAGPVVVKAWNPSTEAEIMEAIQ